MTNPRPETDPARRYRGFTLRNVCWGYRDIFERTIEGLFQEGFLGEKRQEVTSHFFGLLQRADQSCYDHVLKEFLVSLNPGNRWILDLPALFSDVVETGRLLADTKLYAGIVFFRRLGEGGLGRFPEQTSHILDIVRRLLAVDVDLTVSFLRGCQRLLDRLHPAEMDLFVTEGRRMHARSPSAAREFMEGTSPAAESIILSLTRECRLRDIQPILAALLRALTGRDIEIGKLSSLDSDDLIERGSRSVCFGRWLFVPVRVRDFPAAASNRDWYRLMTIAAAGMLAGNTFSTLHGHPAFSTAEAMAGADTARVNLFLAMELARGVRYVLRRWPGARRLLTFGFETEFATRPPECDAERLLRDLVDDRLPPARRAGTAAALDALANPFDAALALDEPWARQLAEDYPGLNTARMRAFSFLPDLLFPAAARQPPDDALVADMKEQARRRRSGVSDTPASAAGRKDAATENRTTDGTTLDACFVYDEWSQPENAYHEAHCRLFVSRASESDSARIGLPEHIVREGRRVRRVFERLQRDEARVERRMETGDCITHERLVNYLVHRRLEPDPRVDFYEKTLVRRRDMAVLLLLDASASTTEGRRGGARVLDTEIHSAIILGQGLAALGDRFAVCAFSTQGRERCEYVVHKDFADPWDARARARILCAAPGNSTRIGVALRHAGWMLNQTATRRRLLILITDGKPMDAGYDPGSRYAQHDVRMACEENRRLGIVTFAISTDDNTAQDMQIMFPGRRFAILQDIQRLPSVLTELYARLTV